MAITDKNVRKMVLKEIENKVILYQTEYNRKFTLQTNSSYFGIEKYYIKKEKLLVYFAKN